MISKTEVEEGLKPMREDNPQGEEYCSKFKPGDMVIFSPSVPLECINWVGAPALMPGGLHEINNVFSKTIQLVGGFVYSAKHFRNASDPVPTTPETPPLTEEPFWLVWKGSAGTPTRRHKTEESAIGEARRLAKINPGRFYVMEAVSFVERPDVPLLSGSFAPKTKKPRKEAPAEPQWKDEGHDGAALTLPNGEKVAHIWRISDGWEMLVRSSLTAAAFMDGTYSDSKWAAKTCAENEYRILMLRQGGGGHSPDTHEEG